MQVADKVVVITGGASGLGHATAQQVVANGGKVMIWDLNEEAALKVIAELGDNVGFSKTNVVDEDSVKASIDATVEKFGAIHVCVNCAGLGAAIKTFGSRGPYPIDKFKFVVDVNLIGTFNVLRLCAEQMAKNEPEDEDAERGLIINTASVAAFDGQVGQVAYSASKGAVVGMTLPIARDLAPLGIRCNTIAPGIFNTPLMNSAPDKVKDPLIAMTQFPKRLGLPSEYGQLAVHMIENKYLNGETIRLDSGIRMQPR